MTEYPFRPRFGLEKRSTLERLKTRYDTWRVSRRERKKAQNIDLVPLTALRHLGPNDLPLVFITRNEITILPSFLKHYKTLGVTRFICVDDGSTDGTREFLVEQSDVDVWTSTTRFKDARRGRAWRESLFNRYGLKRWYLNVDSDEFLVFDQSENKKIPDLIRILEDQGISRLPAPMLDFYPTSNSPSIIDGAPWEVVNSFDGACYKVDLTKRGISVKGGPRKRIYGEENELIKFPLIFWDEHCMFASTIHKPLPYERNFALTWGALLHFKFFTNYREKISEAAIGKQHFNESQHYERMSSDLHKYGSIEFEGEQSIRYENSRQLVELGFIPEISWP